MRFGPRRTNTILNGEESRNLERGEETGAQGGNINKEGGDLPESGELEGGNTKIYL